MKAKDVQKAAVIGCGIIGPDIATVLITHGVSVTLVGMDEQDRDKGISNAKRDLNDLKKFGLLSEQQVSDAFARLSGTTDFSDAVPDADIVYEASLEDIAIKQSVFEKLEAYSKPEAWLCSSTSGLSPEDIAKPLSDKGRMAVTHFWNPPYVVPLVEIIPHKTVPDSTKSEIEKFLRHLGKEPVFLKKDIAGHIGNRLQHALYREALSLIEKGVATPSDIDQVVLNSFGPRFSGVGPMEYFDSCGLDLHEKVQSYLYPTLCNDSEPQKILLDNIESGNLGPKTGAGLYDWKTKDENEFRDRRNSRFIERMRAVDSIEQGEE